MYFRLGTYYIIIKNVWLHGISTSFFAIFLRFHSVSINTVGTSFIFVLASIHILVDNSLIVPLKCAYCTYYEYRIGYLTVAIIQDVMEQSFIINSRIGSKVF